MSQTAFATAGRGRRRFARAALGARLRPMAVVGALLALWFAGPMAALAHPLGNFTVNQYCRLEVDADGVRVAYVLDLAELPTVQDRALLDVDGDGALSGGEREGYLDRTLAEVAAALRLEVDGEAVPLRLAEGSLAFPPGQAGLATTRIEAAFVADAPIGADGARIAFANDYATDRLGWREMVAVHGAGLALAGDDAPDDLSDELRAYPEDLLASPPDERTLALSVAAAPGAPASERVVGAAAQPVASAPATDPVAALATVNAGLAGGLLALAAAAGWGALHALSPGHGKTLVGAYLVGSRGTPRHALFLGLTVTITHTAGVLLLGLVVLAASRAVDPERFYPWLSLLSGATVVVLGATMLVHRLRGGALAIHHHGHGHGHAHDDHDHVHALGNLHDHAHAHDHAHDHDHPHAHAHGVGFVHAHGGGHSHSHLPPGAQGEAVTLRNLLALGVSGGLIPCPSALLALLGAVAIGRAGFGVLVVLAFSVGLAATLAAVGLAFLYAGRLLERRSVGNGRLRALAPALRWAPVGGAAAVTLAGVAILARAVQEIGLI